MLEIIKENNNYKIIDSNNNYCLCDCDSPEEAEKVCENIADCDWCWL